MNNLINYNNFINESEIGNIFESNSLRVGDTVICICRDLSLISKFDIKLFGKIGKLISLNPNGTVKVRLENGEIDIDKRFIEHFDTKKNNNIKKSVRTDDWFPY